MSEGLKFTSTGAEKPEEEKVEFTPVTGEHLEAYSSLTEEGKNEVRRNWEIQSNAGQESKKYFKERQERAQQILDEKSGELYKLLKDANERGMAPDNAEVARALGLEGKEHETLVDIITSVIHWENRGVTAAEVRMKVLDYLSPSSQLITAGQEFNKGRGWYYETPEGVATLKKIIDETPSTSFPKRRFWKEYDK